MADSVKKQQGKTGKPGRPKGVPRKKRQQEAAGQKNRTRYLQGGAVLPERYRNRFMKKMIWDL